jgi:hypothetical protein
MPGARQERSAILAECLREVETLWRHVRHKWMPRLAMLCAALPTSSVSQRGACTPVGAQLWTASGGGGLAARVRSQVRQREGGSTVAGWRGGAIVRAGAPSRFSVAPTHRAIDMAHSRCQACASSLRSDAIHQPTRAAIAAPRAGALPSRGELPRHAARAVQLANSLDSVIEQSGSNRHPRCRRQPWSNENACWSFGKGKALLSNRRSEVQLPRGA